MKLPEGRPLTLAEACEVRRFAGKILEKCKYGGTWLEDAWSIRFVIRDFCGIFTEKLWQIHWLANPTQAAGRGFTTGKTAQDDEVQVLNPDEDLPCDDSVLHWLRWVWNFTGTYQSRSVSNLSVGWLCWTSGQVSIIINYQTGSQPARALPRGLPASMMPVTSLEKYGKNWSSLTWSNLTTSNNRALHSWFLCEQLYQVYIYRII